MIEKIEVYSTKQHASMSVHFSEGISFRKARAELLRIAATAEEACDGTSYQVMIDRDEMVIRIWVLSSLDVPKARSIIDTIASVVRVSP